MTDVEQAQKDLEYLVSMSSTGVAVLEAVYILTLAVHVEACCHKEGKTSLECGGGWYCDEAEDLRNV